MSSTTLALALALAPQPVSLARIGIPSGRTWMRPSVRASRVAATPPAALPPPSPSCEDSASSPLASRVAELAPPRAVALPGHGDPLARWPANPTLANPFGTGTELACEGLMEWLAPRSRARWHWGLDLVPRVGRAEGAKLFAPGEGFVLRRADGHPQWGSYLVAAFRRGDRLYLTGWMHLEPGSHAHLKPRSGLAGWDGRIHRGALLARVGATGRARGAHLHLEVLEITPPAPPEEVSPTLWKGRDWSQFKNPADVFEGLPVTAYLGRRPPARGLVLAVRPAAGASD